MTFDPTKPQPSNLLSDSQGLLLSNNAALDTAFAIDHTAFSIVPNSGFHKKVTFGAVSTPAAPSNPIGIIHSIAGVASAISDIKYINSNASFLLNCVRAFGFCNSAGAILGSQSMNVTSVGKGGNGIYNIVMPAGVLTGINYLIIAGSTLQNAGTSAVILNYGLQTATTFQITAIKRDSPGGLIDVTSLSFVVIQI